MPTGEDLQVHAILHLISLGDIEAYRSLYDKYVQKVYAYNYRITRSAQQSEDLTQELFVKIWLKRSELSRINNFEAWLSIVIRNSAYNFLRKSLTEQKGLRHIMQWGTPYSTSSSDAVLMQKEYTRVYEEAIGKLTPQQKKVFLLSRNGDLKHEEIADRLGISLNTVKNHIKAALFTLRSHLKTKVFVLLMLLIRGDHF